MSLPVDLLTRCTPWFGVMLLAATAPAAVQAEPRTELDSNCGRISKTTATIATTRRRRRAIFRMDNLFLEDRLREYAAVVGDHGSNQLGARCRRRK
ncbi:hypothetical protein CfE428DRAFT_6390 [Chthoniobacter flavus Ellin428]|uniref:Secreted protein n=1 Tax=Chthoniobacter flavus Ellin428 TaxID=497964 RepID=B4DBU9_9BACT|nr:hypothetical protein [Chthoniobacter flavus]EDY16065.1 hypothetical protein CfE428DRAFT_6390 [Chthoniobacter flavus Ellin428]